MYYWRVLSPVTLSDLWWISFSKQLNGLELCNGGHAWSILECLKGGLGFPNRLLLVIGLTIAKVYF